MAKDYEELKREHAEALERLRGLYEDHPELEVDAPDGMLDVLGNEHSESPPEPPDVPEGDPSGGDVVTPIESDATVLTDDHASRPEPPTARERVVEREKREAYQRKQRLYERGYGRKPSPPEPLSPSSGPDLEDAVDYAGIKDPESDDVRETAELAYSMRDYNRAILGLLHEMQDVLLDGISDIETMRARFARMR